jgi:hypothetical protein
MKLTARDLPHEVTPHELNAKFPSLSDEIFEEMRRGIEENGQEFPIIVDKKGRILDGVYRWKILGDAVWVEVRDIPEAKIRAFMMSANSHRRQMTPQQWAMVAAKMSMIAGEAPPRGGDRTWGNPQGTMTQQEAADAAEARREVAHLHARWPTSWSAPTISASFCSP